MVSYCFRYDTGGYAPLFSSCSQDDYLDSLHMGEGTCLHSSPYQVRTELVGL